MQVERASRLSLSVQISQRITAEIQRGRLRSGDRMPGTRTLAKTLGVSRNTVDAAYRSLNLEGWLDSERGRGTIVSQNLPTSIQRGHSEPIAIGFSLPIATGSALSEAFSPSPWQGIYWDFGVPDTRIAPHVELARAYRRVLARPKRRLEYQSQARTPRLAHALMQMLSQTRGLPTTPERFYLTRGSQMALYLTARSLLRPGDLVAVEHPGYVGAWEAFRSAGAELLPIAVDAKGLVVEQLEDRLRERPIKALFLTSHHQFPTTVSLAPKRRMRLLTLAAEHRFAIIEDDYDHEFQYDGRPILPMASADRHGVVVYIGSLSKIYAPGLRIGYVVGPAPLIRRIRALRTTIDIQGDPVIEDAIAELFEDGVMQRHWHRARRIYRSRRGFLCDRLRTKLGDALEFECPAGGMAIWARSDHDVEQWARRAAEQGLRFQTAGLFHLDGQQPPFVRLGFANLDESELEETTDRMRDSQPT